MSAATPSEQTIFEEALRFDSTEAQAAFLESACGNNEALRARVEWLVQAHRAAGGFLRDRTTLADSSAEGLCVNVGRYKLLQKIGEGGCGIVYMAEQTEPVRRRVAVKVIKLGMDTKQVVARFDAERQALALMDHPNIAKVLDAGATETGRPYFVMELVRGIKITEFCDEKNLSLTERLILFTQVCRAVQHAHQKGIIHRDIKPSNILVTLEDGGAVPKVIDFGIAKATAGQKLTDRTLFTAFEQFIGTPAYMSPEQAEMTSMDIDTRSDIYSLGVLLYELLTCHTPFDAKELLAAGLDEMRRTIREKEPIRPSTRLTQALARRSSKSEVASSRFEPGSASAAREPKSDHEKASPEATCASERRRLQEEIRLLRGDLDWIVMKCLEKDRRRRYETANGLASDIVRHLQQEPVLARPPSDLYRFGKMLRRHKWGVTAAAALLVSLMLGIAASTWQAVRATRSREKAEANERESRHLLYIADMNLAGPAWEQNNVARIRDLLTKTASYADRGFEWYYWQRQTHLPIHTLRGHRGEVNAVAISPDGKRILTGGDDRTVRMWDADSGRQLFSFEADSEGVRSAAFSPDGRRIVIGGKDPTTVREAATGKELFTLQGDSTGSWCVAFSPDGHLIAAGNWAQRAKVWDAASGQELRTLTGHSGPVWSVGFSPDSRRIVTGSKDTTAKVWDAVSGQELLTLRGHTAGVSSVAYFPDGQRIVTGSGIPTNETTEDHTAKIWDAVRGEPLLTLAGHDLMITAVAVSPDGRRIVTASDDKTARVWDAATGTMSFTLSGHDDRVRSVAISADGQRIVTCSSDRTINVWTALAGKEPLTFRGHTGDVYAVAISPDGQRIATGSLDNTAKIWDVTTGKELLAFRGHTNPVACVAFSPNGRWIATGSSDGTKVWDADTGQERDTIKGNTGDTYAVAISPDSHRMVTGSRGGSPKVWDVDSGKQLFALEGQTDTTFSAAFSPDGRRIATASADGTAKLWEADSGKELHTLKGHTSFLVSVAFSPDSSRVVTGSGDRTAKIWDVASGRELRTFMGHGYQVFSVAFSPDGRRIITGCFDGTAKVWEAASGMELLTLKGHSAAVRALAISQDGLRIVTGSWDHTAKVWQAATHQQVAAWEAEAKGQGLRPP